jgi:hypothetical protein
MDLTSLPGWRVIGKGRTLQAKKGTETCSERTKRLRGLRKNAHLEDWR